MRVALLTGGGDCPGLNAVIYAAVKKGINHYGDEFIGFLNGWRGVLDNQFIPLTLESIDGTQYSRMKLPIGVPGPTLVISSFSSCLSMASSHLSTSVDGTSGVPRA